MRPFLSRMQYPKLRYFLLLLLALSGISHAKFDTRGLVRLSAINNNAEPSFFDKGTGVFRSAGEDIQLSQFVLETQYGLGNGFDAHAVFNGYSDGDKKIGLTQAFIEYKPLSRSVYQWQSRAGLFYPRLSVENTDIGWLAQNFLTSSAINAWVGEELRIPGIEFSLKRSGRRAKSPWSIRMDVGAYRGNDTIGALLAWRGFAIHDRQTLHHERVEFAPIPAVIDPDIVNSPSWTDPLTEIDGNVGFYGGLQLQYLRKFDLRIYHYDNRADPSIVDERRLYSWNTIFNSVAGRYLLERNTEISFHAIDGFTDMGPQIVRANYQAFYAAISRRYGDHRVALRIDITDVEEDDSEPRDINDFHSVGLTFNYTYHHSKTLQLAVEAIANNNTAFNRTTLGVRPQQSDRQIQLAATYRF